MKEICELFYQEGLDLLELSEKSFLEIHSGADSLAPINQVFRVAHNLKGSANAVGLEDIARFAHSFENVLAKFRDRPELVNEELIALMLEANDCLKSRLTDLVRGVEGPWTAQLPIQERLAQTEAALVQRMGSTGASSADPTDIPAEEHPEAACSNTSEAHAVPPTEADRGSVSSSAGRAPAAVTFKVSAERVDKIQQVVGELALLRGQLVSSLSDPRQFQLVLGLLDKNIRELHGRVVEMKKSPADALQQRLTRLVRDMTRKLGKDVNLTWDCTADAIEKPILDAITDPLIHMVRNSLDHGLETPEERSSKNKPTTGQLTVRIAVDPTLVEVTVRDDGRGVDTARVLARARSKGLVGIEAEAWPPEKLIDLLFAPGFSTAEAVTEFSGRGVGLDVVRSNIEKLDGSVRILSRLHFGTEFRLEIPLLNGLSEALLVRDRNRTYLAGMNGILRVTSFDPKRISAPARDLHLYFDGDQSYRIVPLSNDQGGFTLPTRGVGILVQSGENYYCVPVDHVGAKAQFVVRPLARWISESPGVIGMSMVEEGIPVPFLDLRRLVTGGSASK